MRYLILPVALCACVSRTVPTPVASGAEGLVTAFPEPDVASFPEPKASSTPLLDNWLTPSKAGTPRAPKAALTPSAEHAPIRSADSSTLTVEPAGPATASQRAAWILAQADLAAYHGWIRYLGFRAAHARERYANEAGAVMEERLKLAHWTQKILDDPNVLSQLRGVTEWAYVSPVDGSGQPFKLNIPTDYDPARPAPVLVRLHGDASDHLDNAGDMRKHAGYFELSVLGRARAGQYRALSEADVLHVLDYVSEHWALDLSRVHLVGGGAKGEEAVRLAARYPERFASARPTCGAASASQPIESGPGIQEGLAPTTADEDHPLPPQASASIGMFISPSAGANAAPLAKLGPASCDAKTATGYAEPATTPSREVKHLDFTATDGNSVRAFWAEIAEWGSTAGSARFAIELGSKNRLKARLDNVGSLRLRLAESPVDLDQPLRIAIEGASTLTLPAPLPPDVWLERRGKAWSLSLNAPVVPFRLHAPGGANQLYGGDPLLIVYGTHGDSATVAALQAAAEAASHSSNASWPAASPSSGNDGVSDNQNLFGQLPVRTDTEVTPDELAGHHLVLIGTAEQNTVVAGLAARLPATYRDSTIKWSDGTHISADDRALGLVHYNPDAPSRLIFWVASDSPAAYAASSLAPELLADLRSGADAVVVQVSEPALVESRRFDSRWQWHPDQPSAGLASSTR